MTRRQWITVFIASFIPLGSWLLFWFFRAILSAGLEQGNLTLVFIIPTAIYVAFQIWLAVRAFVA